MVRRLPKSIKRFELSVVLANEPINNQLYPTTYRTLVGIVLAIALIALAAEMLPEVEATSFVIAALLCIIGLSGWDLIGSRQARGI
jgi:hypothetical protein